MFWHCQLWKDQNHQCARPFKFHCQCRMFKILHIQCTVCQIDSFVYYNEVLCHPVGPCGLLMCFVLYSLLEVLRTKGYDDLDTYMVLVKRISSLFASLWVLFFS